MVIKHVFFDLDHTLWDFETNSEKAYAACFKKYNIKADLQKFITAYRPINLSYWKLYREEKISKESLKYRRLKDCFEAVDYPVSDSLINTLSVDYLLHLPKFNQLFEGATELLSYLILKYKLHIITNGFQEVQKEKLQRAGIINYFDQLIVSENVGANKPDPKVFLYALAKAKAQAHESVMIGDNLEVDINGALNVGMKAIHYTPHENHQNDTIINVKSMLEIKEYL